MNSFLYNKGTDAFDERLKQTVTKIAGNYYKGNISTQTEYAYQLKEALLDFYKNIGKPTFKLSLASDIPSYSHYYGMIYQAKSDIITILTGYSEINKEINSFKKDIGSTINNMLKKISNIYTDVDRTENNIINIKNVSNILYYDNFNNKDSNKQYSSIDNDAAAIDARTGVLLLPFKENISITSGLTLKILEGSNGFPGNTHEVYDSINNITGVIKYKSEDDPHLSIENIQVDVSSTIGSNRWFEFEMYNINDEVMNKTAGIGFTYKEDISWINQKDDKLILKLQATLNKPTELNYIQIGGLPKQNSYISNPILKKVTISNDLTDRQVIHLNKEIEDRITIPFEIQEVTNIIFEIEQEESVPVKACRQFSLNIDSSSTPKYLDYDTKNFIQVENPQQSIELLGLKYDKSNKSIIYPDTSKENSFLDLEYIKSKLFHVNKSENDLKIKSEIIDANRFFIGIKEIDLRKRQYKNKGVFVSKSYTTNENIKMITLNADDYIPEHFRGSLKEGEKFENFIKYYICFNNDYAWHEIQPRHRNYAGPCTIIINSEMPIKNRNQNMVYVDSLVEANEFVVKIVLTRPEDNTKESPMVFSFNIEVESEEVII